MFRTIRRLAALACVVAAASAHAQGQVNVICSVPMPWCEAIVAQFQKETGIKVGLTLKAPASRSRRSPPKRPTRSSTSGSAAPATRTCRPPSRACPRNTSRRCCRSCSRGRSEAGRAVEVPHRRHLPRRAGHRLQHRAAREEEARGAGVLEGPGQARVRGRSADGQPQRVRHRVHRDRDAGAGVRRGRGVQVPEGAAQEHQQLPALRRGADQGGRARRDARSASSFIHDVVTEAQAGFPVKSVAPCEGTGYEIGSLSIVKGARNLDDAKKFVRLGADAEGADARRGRQAVPDAVERQHRRCRRCRRRSPTSSSSTTTSRSTARRPSASACSSGGTARSTRCRVVERYPGARARPARRPTRHSSPALSIDPRYTSSAASRPPPAPRPGVLSPACRRSRSSQGPAGLREPRRPRRRGVHPRRDRRRRFRATRFLGEETADSFAGRDVAAVDRRPDRRHDQLPARRRLLERVDRLCRGRRAHAGRRVRSAGGRALPRAARRRRLVQPMPRRRDAARRGADGVAAPGDGRDRSSRPLPDPRFVAIRDGADGRRAAYRNFGAAALQLAHVAEGRHRRATSSSSSPPGTRWRGCLLVEEAGGYAAPFPGPGGLAVKAPVVATAPGIAAPLAPIVAAAVA